jgi:hypothetical protein
MRIDYYKKKFSSILLEPAEWLKKAEQLLESAKLFEPLETLQESENYDFKLSLSCYTSSDYKDIQRIIAEVSSRLSTPIS